MCALNTTVILDSATFFEIKILQERAHTLRACETYIRHKNRIMCRYCTSPGMFAIENTRIISIVKLVQLVDQLLKTTSHTILSRYLILMFHSVLTRTLIVVVQVSLPKEMIYHWGVLMLRCVALNGMQHV